MFFIGIIERKRWTSLINSSQLSMLCTEDLQLFWKLLRTYIVQQTWTIRVVSEKRFKNVSGLNCKKKAHLGLLEVVKKMIGNGSFWAILRTFQAQMAKKKYLMLCI